MTMEIFPMKAHISNRKKSAVKACLSLTQAFFLFAAVSSGVNAAPSAPPVFTGVDYNLYTLPNDIADGLDEEQVFVNKTGVVTATGEHLTGSIGLNDQAVEAYWTTTDSGGLMGLGSGFATIVSGDGGLIHDVTFGVYGSYFEDVIFSVIPDDGLVDITITAVFADGTIEAANLQTGNGLENWLALVNDPTNLFKTVNIQSDHGVQLRGQMATDTEGGLTQIKQWQVSGVTAVPIPAAAWLFGSGLIGLAGIARRRNAS